MHALLPAVSGVLTAHPERAQETFDRGTRFSALVCGAILAAVVPTLVFLVPVIYGSEFATAAWLFVPLAAVSALQSASNPASAFVNSRQRGGVLLKAGCAALAVNLVLAFSLIPSLGAWGAVIASAAALIVGMGWIVVTEPLAGGRGARSLVLIYRPFLAGIPPCALALGVGLALSDTSLIAAAVCAFLVGAAGYVGIVQVAGCGLTVPDRNAVVGAIAERLRGHATFLLRPLTTSNG